jgi:hypothetical protein
MTNKQVTLYKGTREEFEAKYEDYMPMGKSFKEQLDNIQPIGFVFYFNETTIKDEDGSPLVNRLVESDLIMITG